MGEDARGGCKDAHDKAALARKRWQDAIREARDRLHTHRHHRDSVAHQWRELVADLAKLKQEKSALARRWEDSAVVRRRWEETTDALMNANAQRKFVMSMVKLVVVFVAFFYWHFSARQVNLPVLGAPNCSYAADQPPIALGFSDGSIQSCTEIAVYYEHDFGEGDWWWFVVGLFFGMPL